MKTREIVLRLLLGFLVLPLMVSYGQGQNTTNLFFDYTSTTDTLCTSVITTDCIKNFVVQYESAPGVFTTAATLLVSSLTSGANPSCTPITGGVTCKIQTPVVAGKKYAVNTWIVVAEAETGVRSVGSNTVAKESLRPGPPVNVR